MNDFKKYLDNTGEIGYVEQTLHSIVYVSGLPGAKAREVILFETGEVGQVLSLSKKYVEVLLFSKTQINVGTKVTRKNEQLQIAVDDNLLGKTIDPLGQVAGKPHFKQGSELRPVDIDPSPMNTRKNIDQPFETGITIVDLIVPLGKGQRELIVGDRKTGKTQLLMRSVHTQSMLGSICIYAAIAKKRLDIKMIEEYFITRGISKNTVVVATSSSDPAGLVFVTPYAAMTIAEYFRDQGKDVFVVLDDLSAHAKYYREITLLARRFPGRSSYPGDIFYIHSRLLERSGNFQFIKKDAKGKLIKNDVSITTMPVAELVLGDLSGYIQTNLMAMTDGHIFFDSNLYNQGRRPAINPFLSVTRVGRQAQSPLLRDINRQVTSFLVYLEKLREFMHFGAELSESTKRTLALGDRITAFFDQAALTSIPINVNVVLISGLWGGLWKNSAITSLKAEMRDVISAYRNDKNFRQQVNNLVVTSKSFEDIVSVIKANDKFLLSRISKSSTQTAIKNPITRSQNQNQPNNKIEPMKSQVEK